MSAVISSNLQKVAMIWIAAHHGGSITLTTAVYSIHFHHYFQTPTIDWLLLNVNLCVGRLPTFGSNLEAIGSSLWNKKYIGVLWITGFECGVRRQMLVFDGGRGAFSALANGKDFWVYALELIIQRICGKKKSYSTTSNFHVNYFLIFYCVRKYGWWETRHTLISVRYV